MGFLLARQRHLFGDFNHPGRHHLSIVVAFEANRNQSNVTTAQHNMATMSASRSPSFFRNAGSRNRINPVAPVGNLRIHARAEPDDKPGARVAKVTIEVEADGRPVYLTGIVAREARRSWINLSIPPLEQWEESLRWLTPEQRTRIEQPAFYEVLQREIPRRLLNSGSG